MSDEDKLLQMFAMVHGEMTGSCWPEVLYGDDGKPNGVACIKNGDYCWSDSREDLLFAYVTRDFE